MSSQDVARAGRRAVVDELQRRGAIARLSNVPRVHVIATDSEQKRTVRIQVKTKRHDKAEHWQESDAEKLRNESKTAGGSDFVVLVDLQQNAATKFYVGDLRGFAAQVVQRYDKWMAAHGGSRPGGSDSAHTSIDVDDFEPWLDCWDILGIV
ncbi:MAG: hypothetical protein Q8Q00_09560 [Dehalococcoidia bacterium]|nr:hypothetical protein [Dehalococcoidia bacterium]